MNLSQAHKIFLAMTQAWDLQEADDIEIAISMMISYWMSSNEGQATLLTLSDAASNMFVTDVDDESDVSLWVH